MVDYFPNITDSNVTSLTDVVSFNNNITNGLFTPLILLAVWAIVFIGLSGTEKTKASMAATWLTWMLSLLLWAGGMLPEMYVMVLTVLTLGLMMLIMYINIKGPSWN